MRFKKSAIIFILLIFKGLTAFAQQDSISITAIVSKTEKFSAEHPIEKVYLHFDKPYYAVNDTVWFKAYLTIGPKHQLSVLSNIIYVDIVSSTDSLIQSIKLPAINGLAFGDIILSPITFKKGNYHIRAYSNWMRNFGPDYFFNKTIAIGDADNPDVPPSISFIKSPKNNGEYVGAKVFFKDKEGNPFSNKKVNWAIKNQDETLTKNKGITDKNGLLYINLSGAQINLADAASFETSIEVSNKKTFFEKLPIKNIFQKPDVQFFPEGGELISGMRSKVAFKAVNPDGLGIEVTGSIIDNAGNDIADFTSQHSGMGVFALLPAADKSYKAIITFPDGSKNEYPLPKIRTDGIAIAVNNNDAENLSIKVAANERYFKQYQNRGLYIIAQSGGSIFYAAAAALQSQVYTALVSKSKFPTGVLQVTLFNTEGEPLSERVVFIKHNDALNVALSANLPVYTPLQHVAMTISVKNAAVPVTGSFSVAVVDEAKVPYNEDAETTILSNLLLTSDLRGYIEKPNYYFTDTDEKRLADLDILMLTQGYRRFSYTDVIAGKYPPVKYLPERGMEVTGTLRTSAGVAVYKGNVNMKFSDRNFSVNAFTDSDGHFRFPNVSIFDSTKLILSARNNSGNTGGLMIIADVPSVEPVKKRLPGPGEVANIDSALGVYLQNTKKQSENSHVLKVVEIKSTKIEKVKHERYTALTGLTAEADQVMGADMLKYCSGDFEGCVMGKVFGLWFIDEHYYIKRDYDAGNKKPIKFFINGAPIDDSYLTTINPVDIESIEVYLKDGVSRTMQFYDCNGIISITTKTHSFTPKEINNDLSFLTTDRSVITISPKGFYKSRIFYSPRYTNEQVVSKQIFDLRSTIYWNPNIITDKSGNATFDFFNASGRGTYKAVVEGIDTDGNIGRYILRYKVN